MPPKNAGPNKKTQEKVKTKIVEDKTFGLKNKKGAKQQKFIQQVQKQVSNKFQNPRDLPPDMVEREKKKEEERKKKEELSLLFKPVMQTVGKGVDPKSVVCVYFKQGLCQKGDKCKFSHDLNQERKAEKRSIYADAREEGSMAGWDEAQLQEVVNKKHGEDNIKKNQTAIVCKFFIEAVENKTYGWFWACPNGEACIYRHALPPGFTLKSEAAKKTGSEEDEVSLEMLIEKERAALGSNVTKITLDSFLAWKKRKIQEKKDEKIKTEEKKRVDFKLGFMNGLTGRDIFNFNPDMILNDDDEAGNDIDYRRREYDDEMGEGGQPLEIRELDAEYFASQAREVDDTGTVAADDRFSYIKSAVAKQEESDRMRKETKDKLAAEAAAAAAAENGEEEGEEEGEEDEEENEEEDKKNLKKLLTNGTASNIEIDESLFNADDLDEIRDELEDLDI